MTTLAQARQARDIPILFSGPMVRAILDDRKTQTRRILKPQPEERLWGIIKQHPHQIGMAKWRVGDRLWVRENHYLTDDGDFERVVYAADENKVAKHLADLDCLGPAFPVDVLARHKKLRPSIHMPRWASRITLEVTEVCVERLQDISEGDAIAEGIGAMGQGGFSIYGDKTIWEPTARVAYSKLWDRINGLDSWTANPSVTATTFRVGDR